jgi:hypothetical protein
MALAFGVLGAACGGSGGDDTSAGAGAMTGGSAATAKPATVAALAVGTYMLENDSVGATLTIKSATATSVSYSIGILGKGGSEHNGELDGRTAKPNASTGSFDDAVDSDCKISLKASGSDITVKQTGSCSDAGFGAFLDGSGTYKKSAGWVGLYEEETTHRAWAIRITSANPFTFHIFAGNLDDSSIRVDAKDLKGQPQGDTILFEDGPNCALTFTQTQSGLHLSQEGTCESIGVPEDLSLEGSGAGDGADFSRIDESTQCFDTQELGIEAKPGVCKSPL